MLAEVQIRCYIRRLWVPLPRRTSKEGCQWQKLRSTELSVEPCWTNGVGVGVSSAFPVPPHSLHLFPALSLGQTDQRAAGSSSAKNPVGFPIFSDSGYGGQASRPLATWAQEPPAIFPRAVNYSKGFSLVLPKVLAMECLLQRLQGWERSI